VAIILLRKCGLRAIRQATAIVVLTLFSTGAWCTETQQADIVKMKGSLQQRLDSIDVEKQVRKRKGIGLEDLEKAASAIQDSIAALRVNIENRGETPPSIRPRQAIENTGLAARLVQKYAPRNVFDWVVLIVGAIAIMAGLILCIGIFFMIFRKVKRKRMIGEPVKQDGRPVALTNTPIGDASALAALKSEITERTIDSLRKRIGDEKAEPHSPAVGFPAPAHPDATPGPTEQSDLKKNIVEAARQGASIAEISRRFHISTDQVSLIVRVAQKDGEARPLRP